jgi:hypothetical protein
MNNENNGSYNETNGRNNQANGKNNQSTVVDKDFNERHRKSNYHHYHVSVKVFQNQRHLSAGVQPFHIFAPCT